MHILPGNGGGCGAIYDEAFFQVLFVRDQQYDRKNQLPEVKKVRLQEILSQAVVREKTT